MSRFFISVFCFMLAVSTYAADNDSYLSFFSSSAIHQSNTAKDISNLSNEEKEVVLWTNLVRTEPDNFAKMLMSYFQKHPEFQFKNPYVQSLLTDLKKISPNTPLSTAVLLNNNASSHAEYSQLTKKMGHDNFDKRAKIAFNDQYNNYGENCVYGVYDALHAVVCLLVDDGVVDLGHRKIILSNQYNQIGISMKPFYSGQRKVMIQQFGNSTIPMLYTQSETIENIPTASSEPATPVKSSTIKKMLINGKYVLVDTAKYYSVSEYQQYLKKAQQLKSNAK